MIYQRGIQDLSCYGLSTNCFGNETLSTGS